jgi:hypothetical protein
MRRLLTLLALVALVSSLMDPGIASANVSAPFRDSAQTRASADTPMTASAVSPGTFRGPATRGMSQAAFGSSYAEAQAPQTMTEQVSLASSAAMLGAQRSWETIRTAGTGLSPVLASIADLPADLPALLAANPTPFVISGTVTSAATQLAVAGVDVRAQDATTPCCQPPAGNGRTDAQGNYSFSVPQGPSYKVMFDPNQLNQTTGSAYLQQWWNGAADPQHATAISAAQSNVNAQLASGSLISGTLQDAATGAGIAHGFISASTPPPSGGGCCPQNVSGSGTDMNGAFLIVVPAGTYILAGNGPQNSSYVFAWYGDGQNPNAATRVAAPTSGIIFPLQQGFLISGTLQDAVTHSGIANGFVGASTPPPPGGGCCPQNVSGSGTDMNGAFQMFVPAGAYILGGSGPQNSAYVFAWYGDGQNPNNATRVTAPTSGIIFPLQQGFLISGTVTDAATHLALAGVEVRAQEATQLCCQPPAGNGRTDTQGNYSFPVPQGASYKVAFDPNQLNQTTASTYLQQWWNGAADFQSATPISAAQSNVNAQLLSGLRISGTLQDAATNHGIANGFVGANTPPPSDGGCCPQFVNGSSTDMNGAFTMVVPAGTYILGGNGPQNSSYVFAWYGDGQNPNNATRVTPPASGIVIPLQRGFVISGTVTTADGGQPGSVFVNAATRGPDGGPNFMFGSFADPNGNYRFRVVAGTYYVHFFPQPGSRYLPQWYANKRDFRSADAVVVSADQPGIDAVLAAAQPANTPTAPAILGANSASCGQVTLTATGVTPSLAHQIVVTSSTGGAPFIVNGTADASQRVTTTVDLKTAFGVSGGAFSAFVRMLSNQLTVSNVVTFTVAACPTPTPTPSPTPTAKPAAAPTPSPAGTQAGIASLPSTSTEPPGGLAALGLLVAAVLALGIIAWMKRTTRV